MEMNQRHTVNCISVVGRRVDDGKIVLKVFNPNFNGWLSRIKASSAIKDQLLVSERRRIES